jgi:hypothetical protein
MSVCGGARLLDLYDAVPGTSELQERHCTDERKVLGDLCSALDVEQPAGEKIRGSLGLPPRKPAALDRRERARHP